MNERSSIDWMRYYENRSRLWKQSAKKWRRGFYDAVYNKKYFIERLWLERETATRRLELLRRCMGSLENLFEYGRISESHQDDLGEMINKIAEELGDD